MGLIFILFFIIGLIAGCLITYFWRKSSQIVINEETATLKNDIQQALQTISRLEERNKNQSHHLKETEQKKTEAENRAHQIATDQTKIATANQNLRKKLATQKEEMQALQKRHQNPGRPGKGDK